MVGTGREGYGGRVTLTLVLLVLGQTLTGQNAAPVPTVSFDLRPLPVRLYRRLDGLTLERRVALRLAQEGFAFVSPDAPSADIRIHAREAAQGIELEGTSRSGTLASTVRVEEGASTEWQLEVVQKVTELARALTPPPQPPSTPGVNAPPPIASAPVAKLEERADSWQVDATAGVVDRFAHVDPLLLVSAAWSTGSWRLRAELGGSTSEGLGIRVWEFQAAAGVERRWERLDPLTLSAGLSAGLLGQTAQVLDVLAQQRTSSSVFPAGWVIGRAEWRLARHWKVSARAAAGISRSVEHVSEGAVLWSRDPFRAEVGLGVTASF